MATKYFLPAGAYLAGTYLAKPLASTHIKSSALGYPVRLVSWKPNKATPSAKLPVYGQPKSIRLILDLHCPLLTDPSLAHMTPTPFLYGGELQTSYSIANGLKRDRHSNIVYDRELCTMSDGGTVSLDWYPGRRTSHLSNSTPIVIVMTGIGGSSYEYHIRCLAMSLAHQSNGHGCRVVVVNYRGASKTPLTTGKMYNVQDTGDYGEVVQKLKQSYPQAPLVGVGFSLGANLLTRYMGEQGSTSPLAAGIVMCCPFDMHAFALVVHKKSVFNNCIFQPTLVGAYKRLVLRSYDVIKASSAGYNMDALMNIKSMGEFDSLTHAKTHNYQDCWEYYQSSSSTAYVSSIKAPYLAISTMDDPVTRAESIPLQRFQENPYTALALLERGGHLGFFAGPDPQIWYLDPVAEFINGVVSL